MFFLFDIEKKKGIKTMYKKRLFLSFKKQKNLEGGISDEKK